MEVTAGYNGTMVETNHVKIEIGERIYIIRPSPAGGDGTEDGGILVYSDGAIRVGYGHNGSVRLEDAQGSESAQEGAHGIDWDDPKYSQPHHRDRLFKGEGEPPIDDIHAKLTATGRAPTEDNAGSMYEDPYGSEVQ